MEQRTDEWFQARLGKVTASKVADVTAKTRSGWGASRANYLAQLVAERLTGTNQDGGYINAAMQWGIDKEPEAIAAYSFYRDAQVEAVGFVDHPDMESGASPDGLVGDDGLVEVKCPNTATHIATLLEGKVPAKYIKQIQWQLACTGRAWCDFISFDPRMPPEHQLFVARIERDQEMIEELETQVREFLVEVTETINAIETRNQ